MNDDLLFADGDDDDNDIIETHGSWKILIVDDEPEVHAVTKLALNDFVFNDKRLEFLSAYDGEEAKKLFREHTDIAVVLLDVVMETDDAGLRVADYVRSDLDNHFTRIILRTGQPGQAPERDVIVNYDINDYKSKTELTAQKLFSVIIAALRSYRDIMVIEESRAGLEKIIDGSADLFSACSLEKFMRGLIQQVSSILGFSKDSAYITNAVAVPKPISQRDPHELYVFAGNGEYADKEGRRLQDTVNSIEYLLCQQALKEKSIAYGPDHVAVYCHSKYQNGSLLYLSGLPRRLNKTDVELLTLFSENIQVAFEHVLKNADVESTHRPQMTEKEVLAKRQIYRMMEMSALLGRLAGLDDNAIHLLKHAVALHDVGQAKISMQVLHKRDTFNEDEQFHIRQHAEFGYQIFKDSDYPTIQLAAKLARQHHERWDGKGYPQGLKKDEISLQSRIAAVIDVFDFLVNLRSYKDGLPLNRVIETFETEKARHFDPVIVDLLIENIDQFMTIQTRPVDTTSR